MKRGFSLSTLKAGAHSYALRRHRGVGPGTKKPAKEEATMDARVRSEPLLKRPKGPGMSASRQNEYIHKVAGSAGYRRAEGLLGRFVGQG
eukprot:9871427-Alexandrium_andersonii.AAC.1